MTEIEEELTLDNFVNSLGGEEIFNKLKGIYSRACAIDAVRLAWPFLEEDHEGLDQLYKELDKKSWWATKKSRQKEVLSVARVNNKKHLRSKKSMTNPKVSSETNTKQRNISVT